MPNKPKTASGLPLDPLRGSSVKIGTIQRRLAWLKPKEQHFSFYGFTVAHPQVTGNSKSVQQFAETILHMAARQRHDGGITTLLPILR